MTLFEWDPVLLNYNFTVLTSFLSETAYHGIYNCGLYNMVSHKYICFVQYNKDLFLGFLIY